MGRHGLLRLHVLESRGLLAERDGRRSPLLLRDADRGPVYENADLECDRVDR